MGDGIKTVELANLALALIPVAAVVFIYLRWTTRAGHVCYALTRMLVQLLTVGYFLAYLLATDIPWLVIAILLLMIAVASWIALNTVLPHRNRLLLKTVLAIGIGGGSSLFIMSQWVLEVSPWYSAQYLIPLGGMVFANAITSVSLCAERFFAEAKHQSDYHQVRAIAFNASLIPMVNSLFAVGLVSLPGMMTGQILSGVAPLIAARYQIMVMCMLFAASGISSALLLHWLKPLFDELVKAQAKN